MTRAQHDLFAANAERLVYDDAVEMTLASLQAYAPAHDHWAVAWSGGKDSTATLTLLIHLIEVGRLDRPKSLTVYYADTRMELTPLAISAAAVMERLKRFPWVRMRVVTAPLDRRFLVYILGRGVPPPNNNTLRWCTRQIKIDPMAAAIEADLAGLPVHETVLTITGVRQGESAIRDRRIEMSCSRDGAECGQGWYQQVLPGMRGVRGRIATLAPILHWRVCNVWDWLKVFAPAKAYGGWATAMLADAYGGDDAEDIEARTGCLGCPLASKDKALESVVALPAWSYLAPLLGLRAVYRDLRLPRNRLRQPGGETRADGSLVRNQQRMGPITLPARLAALNRILAIQDACNQAAFRLGRPLVDILNDEEEDRIRELVAAGTWPQRWSGKEPTADTPLDAVFPDGTVQLLLIGAA